MAQQRLIDANALMLEPDEHNVMNGIQFKGRRAGKTIAVVQKALKLMINSATTIDAVPVVRCRECKYHRNKECPMRSLVVNPAGRLYVADDTVDDGFCHKGAKMDAIDNNVGHKDGGAEDEQ